MLNLLLRRLWQVSPQSASTLPPAGDARNKIIFLIMRRMRMPLLVLLISYVIAVVGMTLMPGMDGNGQPWNMGFFHAFYFISYTATTIGFGEIPYAFSDAQRLWATVSIYLTVIAWVYAIGGLMTLLQDEALRRLLRERAFERSVRGLREPFYLVCGYGDTGEALVNALEDRLMRSVVIEILPERIDELTLHNYPVDVPKLCADASKPAHLLLGGLQHPFCRGVVAITNDNQANLHIAIAAKLLNPELRTICRADSDETAANMASFHTDRIINPFALFAGRLHGTLHAPCIDVLRQWLGGVRGAALGDPIAPPSRGLWILCGYGRFGKALYKRLREEKDIELIVVEATFDKTGVPPCDHVVGWGTEAATLREARIDEAVGIVAGTDNDVNNLSIIMTARELNPKLFVILRQNRATNDLICAAAKADLLMRPNRIIANYIRMSLMTPMLVDFLILAKKLGNAWACELASRLAGLMPEDTNPAVWELELTPQQAPGLCEAMQRGQLIQLGCLLRDPRDYQAELACLPLLLVRDNHKIPLPDAEILLQQGDRVLWCGAHWSDWWMEWTLNDPSVLHYLSTGETLPRGWAWEWLQRRR
jgi:Trk K+ transport system NAD-binding subunit